MQANASDPNKDTGLFSQIPKTDRVRFMKSIGFFRNVKNDAASFACKSPHEYHNPTGAIMLIPNMPINRSAAIEARHTARSNPICMAPAKRIKSPPTVVGRKCDANRLVKVNAMLS